MEAVKDHYKRTILYRSFSTMQNTVFFLLSPLITNTAWYLRILNPNSDPDGHLCLATHNSILVLPSLKAFLASIRRIPQPSSYFSWASDNERMCLISPSIFASNQLQSWSVPQARVFYFTKTINRTLHNNLRRISPIPMGRTPWYLFKPTSLHQVIVQYMAHRKKPLANH